MRFFTGETDVLDEPFNPGNAAHVALAMKDLGEFKQARDRLMALDQKVALGVGCDMVLYLTGFLGALTASLMLVGIGYLAIKQGERPEHARDFKEKLERMEKICGWMKRQKIGSVTNHELFMEVSEAVVPFLSSKEADVFSRLLSYWPVSSDQNNDAPESVQASVVDQARAVVGIFKQKVQHALYASTATQEGAPPTQTMTR